MKIKIHLLLKAISDDALWAREVLVERAVKAQQSELHAIRQEVKRRKKAAKQ